MFKDFTIAEINTVMEDAWTAFHAYRKLSLKQRAAFMRSIAIEISNCDEALIKIALEETNLPEARLISERERTIFQLNSYAAFCESGQWMDIRIHKGNFDQTSPKTDIRKMLVPLGPVIVFGAANFPFAYSTAGGDTACAFAAGCPVIVKAHPGHAETSEMVAGAILKAAASCDLPKGIFAHVHGASTAVGEALVKHAYTKAVGFTGSFAGGKQLFDWGNQRLEPIPVFAEMSSVNPVFLLPEKMNASATEMAKMLAASISLSVGQFCTNPGIIIGINGEGLETFIDVLSVEIKKIVPAAMLNGGIYKNYVEKREKALLENGVVNIANPLSGFATADRDIATADRDIPTDDRDFAAADRGNRIEKNWATASEDIGTARNNKKEEDLMVIPTIATTTAQCFIANPLLQQEVFGPYAIIIRCSDISEMTAVAKNLQGQLTATLLATENDITDNETLVDIVKNICGRFILNGVPTGVEVCLAMQHGGPFPSTTDSRFTAVGADGIRRFARPLCFQNWPDALLPDELKDENPLGIVRTVNNEISW
ncbi:MAG: aldehyde dehydrogenase (NADP(+)) [Ferruginibacter sp.]